MRVQISAGRALKERAVYTVGPGPVCECMDGVHWKGVYRVQNFFNLFLKLTNQRRSKVTCLLRH